MSDFSRIRILRRELTRHARTLERLAAELERAEDYPTPSAAAFCGLVRASVALMADRMASAPAEKLKHIHLALSRMGAHLRYAERSRIEHTPWSMVQATEAFLKEQAGADCCFIIRPQWAYNYGIDGDFVAKYRSIFSSLSDWIPVDDWTKAIGNCKDHRIYCLSFPRIERMNVLMHVNCGHEIGHILAGEWLKQHFDRIWQRAEPAIIKRLEQDFRKRSSTLKDQALIAREMVSELTKNTMHLTKVAFAELISDVVGVQLFGPASLASLHEISVRFDLDCKIPEGGDYPPFRYRLRYMYRMIRRDFGGPLPRLLRPYVRSLNSIARSTKAATDIDQLKSEIQTREAYRLVERNWRKLVPEVIGRLPKSTQTRYRFDQRTRIINELVLRLHEGIPPNEIGNWPNGTPASLGDIWNAAWAYYCAKTERDPQWGSRDDFQDLFELVLKAIESSFVHTSYKPRLEMNA